MNFRIYTYLYKNNATNLSMIDKTFDTTVDVCSTTRFILDPHLPLDSTTRYGAFSGGGGRCGAVRRGSRAKVDGVRRVDLPTSPHLSPSLPIAHQNSLTACDELMSACSWSCSGEWRTSLSTPGTLRTRRWPATMQPAAERWVRDGERWGDVGRCGEMSLGPVVQRSRRGDGRSRVVDFEVGGPLLVCVDLFSVLRLVWWLLSLG